MMNFVLEVCYFFYSSESVKVSAGFRGHFMLLFLNENQFVCSAHNKMYGAFYSFKQNLFIPRTKIFVYEIFENIPSSRIVFAFDVHLLNLQFRTAGVYSIRVFCNGRLPIVGCHTYQSAGIQSVVRELLACFNLPIISLHSSRKKYDEYVTSAYTRFSLLLPRLSPFRLRQNCHCLMSEGRSIAK
jgi:hypothetical protein